MRNRWILFKHRLRCLRHRDMVLPFKTKEEARDWLENGPFLIVKVLGIRVQVKLIILSEEGI